MALPNFGITAADIRVPGMDLAHIAQSSTNDISLNDLNEFLDEARGDIAVEFRRRDLEAADMTDGGDSLAKRYIKHYTVAEALELYGHSGEVHDDAKRKRDRAWTMFKAYLDEGADQGSAVQDDTRLLDDQPFTFAGSKGENYF